MKEEESVARDGGSLYLKKPARPPRSGVFFKLRGFYIILELARKE